MDNLSANPFLIDPLTSAIFPIMKQCARGKEEKPFSDFNNRQSSKDGKQSYCRDCQASYQIRYKYDLSQEAFDEMYVAQAGLCYLCKKTCEKYATLSVDHCAILGVRKLLCMRCIGFLKSFSYDPIVIRKAIAYVTTKPKLYYVRVAIEEPWEEAKIKTTMYITRNGLTYKWCPKCKMYQSADDHFYAFQEPSGQILSHSWCIPCCKAYGLESRYGINNATKEHWELLHEHCCWICEERRSLCVDHDHREPRRIRGLLCHPCNTGLGYYQDDTALMCRAAEYLEAYIIPFFARYLPLEDEMIEAMDHSVEGGQVLVA